MAIIAWTVFSKLRGPPVYVFHEIVHNSHVVEDFQRRGVVFVESIGDVPEGAVGVYSAMASPPGSPAVEDATPLWKSSHMPAW